MRLMTQNFRIFDTQVDTSKIYVSMKHKFSLRSWDINSEGKSLLYLHVWKDQPRKRIPLDIYVDPRDWDKKLQRVIEGRPGASDLNLIIDLEESKITAIKIQFRLAEKVLTIEKFVEEYHQGMSRLDFVAYFYNAKERDYKNGNVKFNTWKKENSVYTKFKEWKPKLSFSEFTPDVIEKFKVWRRENGIASTSVNSNLAILKKYIGQAMRDGIKMPIDRNDIVVGSTEGHRE